MKNLILFLVIGLQLVACNSKNNAEDVTPADSLSQVEKDKQRMLEIEGIKISKYEYDRFNADSLLQVHSDSLLFMNYWSGMTKKEWAVITSREIEAGNIISSKSYGDSEFKYWTILTMNKKNYFFKISFVEEDFPLHNFIKLSAGKQTFHSNLSEHLNENEMPYFTEYYEFDEYKEIHDFFHKKYSNKPKILLDDGNIILGKKRNNLGSPWEEIEALTEYRIDGNRAINYREIPFPYDGFRQVHHTVNPVNGNSTFIFKDKNGESIAIKSKIFTVIYRSTSDVNTLKNMEIKSKKLETEKNINEMQNLNKLEKEAMDKI